MASYTIYCQLGLVCSYLSVAFFFKLRQLTFQFTGAVRCSDYPCRYRGKCSNKGQGLGVNTGQHIEVECTYMFRHTTLVNIAKVSGMVTNGARLLSDIMPDSRSREHGFESHFLPLRSLAIFVLTTTPQYTYVYKRVHGCRRRWTYECILFARNYSVARMLPDSPVGTGVTNWVYP